MFHKEFKSNNLIDYLDHFFPSCTLCNDTSYWSNGTLCLCDEPDLDRLMLKAIYNNKQMKFPSS